MSRLARFKVRDERPIHQEVFIEEWPEAGLAICGSPNDPRPSLQIENGLIVEMDGRAIGEFDLLDRFIVKHALDREAALEAMGTDSAQLARMLVDVNVSRPAVARLIGGCTPAKLVEVVRQLNTVEMMAALQKMRIRRRPENQAHVTNRNENPALLAADAAEAARRGFAEEETTTGIARYAPLNAIALLVGSQTGRGGVLTQCSVEESLGLRLALSGLTSYAETLSVYGTERAFVDGDDTPWSKAFLAAAYASRGVKIRFTSGTGSEALMGHHEGKSMLYLEARCLLAVKGAGSQGVQNGSISLVALPMSLPGGVWGILAENLMAAMLGLEVASGNDALSSHSQIRKAAKLMLQFLPGTDFITSGYSSMPKADNMFGGGNFDADDLDDWYVLQRDMMVDGGIQPVSEEAILQVRTEAVHAIQAVFEELGLPAISEAEAKAAIAAYDSSDMPERDQAADLAAADRLLADGKGAIDIVCALTRRGFRDLAERVLEMQRQRVIGDYLQPAAVFDAGFRVKSAINDPNDYLGPGTGYRLQNEPRWSAVRSVIGAQDPRRLMDLQPGKGFLREMGPAAKREQIEVVVGLGPAFGTRLHRTIAGLDLENVLAAVLAGIAEVGVPARLVKVYDTSDLAFIGHAAAQLSGSGIAIGIQSKGTTVIQRRDLPPLSNLELFPMAPTLTLDSYRAIGHNAACYALGRPVRPVPRKIDNTARLRLIVLTTILHAVETQAICRERAPFEVEWGEVDHGE